MKYRALTDTSPLVSNIASDRYSGDHYSGNDHYRELIIIRTKIELGLFPGFEDMTALEDKKSLTVFQV